jgi:hypothetical protein
MRFKDALSKRALEEYGTLGKLIKQKKIEEPKEPDRSQVELSDKLQRTIQPSCQLLRRCYPHHAEVTRFLGRWP